MPTYRLDIAYDGSGFHGYARQPGVRTVQGVLEDSLEPIAGPVDSVVAGRTDSGVHASGQVVSFTVADPLDVDRLRRSLNRRLGAEIVVLRACEADESFHARFSATGRAYRYVILNREVPDPFLAATTWHQRARLDVEAMRLAASHLVGEHDFGSFCRKAGPPPATRTVLWADWHRDGDLVELSIAATSFCHHMVRSIAALGVAVGRGRIDARSVPAIIEATDRAAAAGAAPAHGLTLVAVSYGDELPRRPAWMARH